MEEQKVIVQVDKTVVGITGVEIRGLNTKKLEDLLKDRLKTLVRLRD